MFETSTSTYAGDFSNSNEFNSVAAPYNPYARAQQQQPQQLYTQQQQQHDDDGLSFVDLFDTRGRATDLLSSYVVEVSLPVPACLVRVRRVRCVLRAVLTSFLALL